MKTAVQLLVALAAVCSSQIVYGQNAGDKPIEFAAGKPLGATNEAGEFVPISDNVKVYGSFRFAESCTYDPTRNLIVVMNAGVSQELQKNDGFVSLLNPDGSVHTTKWIGATRDGLTLNHPLGSAIQGNTLYAADVDVVRTFDLETGHPQCSCGGNGSGYCSHALCQPTCADRRARIADWSSNGCSCRMR